MAFVNDYEAIRCHMESAFGKGWDEKTTGELLMQMASWRSDDGAFSYVVPVSRFTLAYMGMLELANEGRECDA